MAESTQVRYHGPSGFREALCIVATFSVEHWGAAGVAAGVAPPAVARECPADFDSSKELARSDWKPIFLDEHQNETLMVLAYLDGECMVRFRTAFRYLPVESQVEILRLLSFPHSLATWGGEEPTSLPGTSTSAR